ncbi:putative glycosyltransferase 6 domain-containing protein 1 [Saimiri boliviensis]|uniref:N-acetyllactosaminide alpha-1,3-galactosyltransferase n=1 Tax=Saimiri boliviensis boliviensis TaxID=39432 RepID=A0A2K6S509_SAIBB|nr:putative glycosyltransferase 6 domain-containing protein 1 [Saimiri boliviensis boliviensis]
MNLKRMLLLVLFVFSLMLVKRYFRNCHVEELQLSDWFQPRKRPDVITKTDWLAPVLWEGTFDRRVLEKHYRRCNITVGLAVFATGRFAEENLRPFLHSANKYFMTGYRVIFYVMVDSFFKLPQIEPSHLRTFKVFKVSTGSGRPDGSLEPMKSLGEHIVSHIQGEVDFLFSMAANQVFQSEFGVETLGPMVAQLHAWWYFRNTKNLPYERRPASAACIPFGQGDFYYDSLMVGGTPQNILDFIENYLNGVIHDNKNGLHSTYEKHLNKYFYLNKPSMLLSPEYSWDLAFSPPPEIQYVKVAHASHRKL